QELRYLLEDVGAAKLRPGEEAELLQERALVQNGARITDLVATAYTLLYAGEEGGRHPVRPIVEALGSVCDALAELAKIDHNLNKIAEQASELLYGAEDLAAGVRAYRDAMEFDPARLDTIEDRLTLIREMQRRFHGSIEQILERAASAEAEIERLTHSDEHMAELEAQESRLLAEVGALAGDLSRRRRAVGDRLAEAVAGAMRDLAMPHVRFAVALEHQEDPQGVPVEIENEELKIEKESDKTARTILNSQFSIFNSKTYAFDKTGIDKIEFLLSPNPGEPLKPLARIASG